MEIQIVVPEVTLATVVADVISVDEDGESYPEGVETVGDKVARVIAEAVMRSSEYVSLKSRVTTIRTEEIRAAVQPIIAEALQAPIRKTNSYGEATGQETTLKEIIMDEARKAWTPNRNSYDRQPSVQEVIAAEVRKHISGEVAKAVKEAQAAALKAVGELAAASVVEAVKKATGK